MYLNLVDQMKMELQLWVNGRPLKRAPVKNQRLYQFDFTPYIQTGFNTLQGMISDVSFVSHVIVIMILKRFLMLPLLFCIFRVERW